MKIDTHTHSEMSGDCSTPLTVLTASAESKGIGVLAITDHLDYDYRLAKAKGYPCMDVMDAASYNRTMDEFIASYKGKVRLLKGIEMGYCAEAAADYAAMLEQFSYDTVLNSVHTVDGMDVYYHEYYAMYGRREGVRAYLKKVLESVYAPYSYDVIGHVGYIGRYLYRENIPFTYEEYRSELNDIFKAVAERDKCLELNTKTKGTGESIPFPDCFKTFKAMGGRKVTIGSDAHEASLVGSGYDAAAAILKNAGFGEVCYYCKRKENTVTL